MIAPFGWRQFSPAYATRGEIFTVVSHHAEKCFVGPGNCSFEIPHDNPHNIGLDQPPDLRFQSLCQWSISFLERCPQSIGLSEQKELCEARLADLIGKFTTHLLECRRQQEFPSARAHCCIASRKTSSRTPATPYIAFTSVPPNDSQKRVKIRLTFN